MPETEHNEFVHIGPKLDLLTQPAPQSAIRRCHGNFSTDRDRSVAAVMG